MAAVAVVALGVAAGLAHAAEGYVVLPDLTTFGGTVALIVMTVRRRIGIALGTTTLVVGVATANGPAAVMGACAGALAAVVAVGVAIPLWDWLSPRPLRLDDLPLDDLGIDDLGSATSSGPTVRQSPRR